MGINQETRTCGRQPVNLVVFDDTGVTYLSLNHPDDFFATAANGTVGSSKQESPKAKSTSSNPAGPKSGFESLFNSSSLYRIKLHTHAIRQGTFALSSPMCLPSSFDPALLPLISIDPKLQLEPWCATAPPSWHSSLRSLCSCCISRVGDRSSRLQDESHS